MKTLSILLPAILAGNLWAFMGNAPQKSGDESLARLFGKSDAFTATADIVVKDRRGREQRVNGMQYAFRDGMLRTEMKMEEAAGMGMDRIITLTRPEKNATYMIYPGLKAYTEIAHTGTTADKAGKEPKIERAELGVEKIDGHPCKKQKIIITDEDGKTQEILAWVAVNLKDFPIRTEIPSEDGTVITTFRDIKLAKPDASLFELPKDYRRYGSMQEMMMESMKQMMMGDE